MRDWSRRRTRQVEGTPNIVDQYSWQKTNAQRCIGVFADLSSLIIHDYYYCRYCYCCYDWCINPRDILSYFRFHVTAFLIVGAAIFDACRGPKSWHLWTCTRAGVDCVLRRGVPHHLVYNPWQLLVLFAIRFDTFSGAWVFWCGLCLCGTQRASC